MLSGTVLDNVSKIGPPVWSNEWFQEVAAQAAAPVTEVNPVTTESMAEAADTAPLAEAPTTEEVAPLAVPEHIEGQVADPVIIPRNTKRKATMNKTSTLSGLYQELSKPNLDAHALITSLRYGSFLEEDHLVFEQPFRVLVHPQVAYMCDIHSHMSESEVIGLLAGKWDAENRILYVQAPFSCTSTDRHDDGSTDVELDPIAELQVREVISSMDMVVVGWYHSHPKFRPDPSVSS